MSDAFPSPAAPSNPEGGLRPEDYEHHSTWLRGLARSLVQDPSTADDLVQETWLSALRSGPSRDEPLRPWLARVVKNAARKLYRTEDRRQHREALRFDAEEPLLSAEELTEHADLIHTLMGEVRELTEPYRSTVLQSYLQGLSSVEIARRSGVPEGTIRWRLRAARDELRERMDRRTGGRENWAALVLPFGVAAKVAASKVATTAAARSGARWGASWLSGLSWWLPALALAGLAFLGTRWLGMEPIVDEPAITLSPVEASAGPSLDFQLASVPSESTVAMEVPLRATATAANSVESRKRAASPLDPGQASVGIQVVGADGEPIGGARVSWTGSRDVFRSTGPDGTVRLLFRPPVNRARLEFLVESRGYASVIAVGRPMAGSFVDLGTVTLESAAQCTGVVRNEEGQPVGGARVFAAPLGSAAASPESPLRSRTAPEGWANAVTQDVATRSNGAFAIDGVPSRPMRIWAVAEGTWYCSSAVLDLDARRAVEVTLLALPDHERISGTVIGMDGQPATDVIVKLVSSGAGSPDEVKVEAEIEADAHGRFQFQPREPGRYTLLAEDLMDRWADTQPLPVTAGEREVVLRFREEID